MLGKESIDIMATAVFQSFLAQCDRLKLADKTASQLVSVSRTTFVNWRKGKTVPDSFCAVLLMLQYTDKLAEMTELQAKSLRRKDNAVEMLLDFFSA